MAFPFAPRRFGGHRINTAPKNYSLPRPAGIQDAVGGGSFGGINSSVTGWGAPMAQRTGSTQRGYVYTNPGGGQSFNGGSVPAGISTAQNPGMQAPSSNMPMAFEDGGAVDDESAIPDNNEESPSAVSDDEGAEPTGNEALENNDASQDKTTRNINDALAKVDAAFQNGRSQFGLTANMRRSTNITDSRTPDGSVNFADIRANPLKQLRGLNPMNALRSLAGPANEPASAVMAIPGTLADQAGYNDIDAEGGSGNSEAEYRADLARGLKRYDDGGAIEDDDTTGSVDNQQDAGGAQSPVSDPATDNVPRLAAYVQGAGAASPDTVDSWLSQYHHLPKEIATVQALADAVEPQQFDMSGGGLDTGFGKIDPTSLLQGYRQHYDHGRAYAVAAANGNAQKPANMEDSVKAANDAFPYVPDGERVHFAVGPNNSVNVSIGGPNGEQRANTTLTPEQYKAFLMQSDFDNVYERTPSLMLQEVMRKDISGVTTGPNPPAPQGGEFMAGAATAEPQAAAAQEQTGQQVAQNTRPTPEHHPGYNMYTNARGTYFVPEDIDARSQALTGGWLSREEERQNFINAQMQQGIKNEIDTLKARNPLGVQQLRNEGALQRTQYASSLKAAWEDRRTQGMIMINLDKIAAQHENDQAKNAANLARSMLLGGVDPSEVPDNVKKMTGVDMSKLLTLGQNTPQAPNAGNSRNPPPTATPYGGKNTQVAPPQNAPQTIFKDGKLWYKTPRGTWSDQPQ